MRVARHSTVMFGCLNVSLHVSKTPAVIGDVSCFRNSGKNIVAFGYLKDRNQVSLFSALHVECLPSHAYMLALRGAMVLLRSLPPSPSSISPPYAGSTPSSRSSFRYFFPY